MKNNEVNQIVDQVNKKPVIEKVGVSEYSMPIFKVNEDSTGLVNIEQTINIKFLRPETPKILPQQKEEIQTALSVLKSKKGKKSEEDQERIKKLTQFLKESEGVFESQIGVSVGDMMNVLISELKSLNANQHAIHYLISAKHWMNEPREQ